MSIVYIIEKQRDAWQAYAEALEMILDRNYPVTIRKTHGIVRFNELLSDQQRRELALLKQKAGDA